MRSNPPRLRVQTSTGTPLATAGVHVFPEAVQLSVPAVHVLAAEQVCTAAEPDATPVGFEQRVSTEPRSLPPTTPEPTHSTHALPAVVPRLVLRHTLFPVHAVVPVVGSAPCAVQVPTVSVPVKGVPGAGIGFPTQTTAFGMH